MIKSTHMNRFKSQLLYQDEPGSGWSLRLILLIIPVILIIFSFYLWFSGESSGSLVLLVEGLFFGLLFWAILPRKYQLFEDRVSIVLGGPFAFNVEFKRIRSIEVTARSAFTINFATRITRNYVIISMHRGLSIVITPERNELFVENFNRALNQWKKNNPG
jgi:hypothetical protein